MPFRFLVVLLAMLCSMHGARIYYTDQPAGAPGSIMAVGLDGTSPATIITYPGTPDLRGIAWNRASGRIYFLDNNAHLIRSIFANGSGQFDVAAVNSTLVGSDVEIDDTNGKLYWTEHNPGTTGNGYIRRTNLDGSGAETVVTTGPGTAVSPYFMFIDAAAGWIYWGVQHVGTASMAQNGPTNFSRNSLAGVLDPSWVITTQTRSRDIHIDPFTATAYWNDRQSGQIFRRAVAGGINELVLSGLNAPHGIALDVAARKIYWADTGQRGSGPAAPNSSSRRVARCNFNGTEFEQLTPATLTSTNEPWDLALDLSCPAYADWRSRFFGPGTPLALPLDDADNDGTNNLLEYAFDSHPRGFGAPSLPAAAGNGIDFLRRRISTLTYRVEVSTDLAAWHYNGDGTGLTWTIEGSVTAVDAEMDRVTVGPGPALSGASRVFFRVSVSMP